MRTAALALGIALAGCHEDATHADIGGALSPAPLCAELVQLDCPPLRHARLWELFPPTFEPDVIDEIVTLDDPISFEGWVLTQETCVDEAYLWDVDLARAVAPAGVRHFGPGDFHRVDRDYAPGAQGIVPIRTRVTTCVPESITAVERITHTDPDTTIEVWPPVPPE